MGKTYTAIFMALLSGIDDSFIGLNMGDGFVIEKLSIFPNDNDEKYQECLFGDKKNASVYSDIYMNCLTEDGLFFYCIWREKEIEDITFDKPEAHLQLARSLDMKLRWVQLYCDAPINVEFSTYSLYSLPDSYRETMLGTKISFQVSQRIQAITNLEKNELEAFLAKPNANEAKNLMSAFAFFTHSYYCAFPELAVTLLISGLEQIFMKNNEGSSKQVPLAKRASISLSSEFEIEKTKRDIMRLYDLRSKYVHSATSGATKEDVLAARDYLRHTLKRLFSMSDYDKNSFISDLRKKSAEIWPKESK